MFIGDNWLFNKVLGEVARAGADGAGRARVGEMALKLGDITHLTNGLLRLEAVFLEPVS